MLEDKLKLLKDAFYLYLQKYLKERDLITTLKLINPNEFSGIGTGIDEVVHNYKEAEEIYSRGIDNVNNKFKIENQNFEFVKLDDITYLVYGFQDISSNVGDICIRQKGIRHSFIFKFLNGSFKLTHVHSSLPCHLQNEGESYPLQKLQLENKHLERLVNQRTLELENALEEIEKIASTDYLTGILNRRKFEEKVFTYMANEEHIQSGFCIAIFDIDDFKSINDKLGHIQGDIVLKMIAEIISENIRKYDIFARWGGEEFILFLPSTDIYISKSIIENILNCIRNYKDNLGIKVTVSCGLSSYLNNDNLETLIIRADKALYNAKYNGKNRLEIM